VNLAIGGDGAVYWPVFSQGYIQAVDPATGTQKWQWSGYANGPPTVGPDGTILVSGSHLYGLNPANGTAKWTLTLNVSTYASPAVYYPVQGNPWAVAHAASTKLYWVNFNGQKLWEYTSLENENFSSASPMIGPDGTVFLSGGNSLYAVNKQGTLNWRLTLPGKPGSPVLGTDGTVYVSAGDKRIYAVTPDGKKKWEHLSLGTLSTPLIDLAGTIWTGAGASLEAVNPDGTSKLSLPLGGTVYGIAMGSNGTIYAASSDKKVYAVGQK